MDYLSFISYNSTGFDSVKANWIRDLIETFNCDCIQIQEHFKSTKTIDTYFKKQFPTCDSYVIPAHREPYQDSGRAKGGLTQLVSKSLNIKKEKIGTSCWRLQCQILHINSYKLLWLNCYFPTDPQILNYDESDLLSVLTEIEFILDTLAFDDCIIGGDLNYDPSRFSGFSNTVRNFMERLGLFSVWEKFNVDFTHVHTDGTSTSVLDHFLVNERLLSIIEDAGPLHLGDNLSRHSPIMMKIRLPNLSTKQVDSKSPKLRRPAWYKASENEINKYTNEIETQLSSLTIPGSLDCKNVDCKNPLHNEERDKTVLDVLCKLVESSYKSTIVR